MSRKNNPFKYLAQHSEAVVSAIKASDDNLPKAWAILQETIPDIQKEMAFRTFKQYSNAVETFQDILEERVRQKMEKIQGEPGQVPARLDGWSIQLKGGYYRLYKRIKGKLHWLHVGRQWDESRAKEKLRAFLHPAG